MAIKTAKELATAAEAVAKNCKTLYVMGCFGAPMTENNKQRYISHHEYNRRSGPKAAIMAATADTFGFDCVCFIKGLLWGWNGDASKVYGGAIYQANNVPDIDADSMMRVCKDLSTDFSDIEVGEYLWMKGHCGLYIGNGLAVECTPSWKNRVQITAVHNIGKKSGYNGRKWTNHGKLPYVSYAPAVGTYSHKQFVQDVQKAISAAVDGIAGQETLGKTPTISAKHNATHAVVKSVQKRLYALGYVEVGEADGMAGPKFTSAMLHYQQDNGDMPTGLAEAEGRTWRKLLGIK